MAPRHAPRFRPEVGGCAVKPEQAQWIAAEFIRCKTWLQAALDRDIGTHSIDDVWHLLLTGPVQIWPTPNAVMLTVLEAFPQKKMLRGWLSGGKLEEIQAMEPRIRAWAKSQGCDVIVIGGRRGWLRAFDGYEESSTVMVRHLDHE